MELINEQEREFRFGDSGPKYLFRGPRFEWGLIVLKPGQQLGRHCHQEVEEHFYVLAGTPKMAADNQELRLQPGDVIRLEAPECHNIINDTQQDIRLVFIKCPYLPNDKIDM